MAKTKVTGEYLKDSVVRFTAKAGENITKGNAVYISGISGELPVVSLADADDTAKMPAFGLAEATVSTNAEVEVTSFGTLADLDTSSYTLGDILYVGTTAGALTNDPAGLEATKLQNIGIVQRVHASNGSIKVGGAGRTNAVPNLDNGDIFIGNSDNKAVSSALSTEIESYLDGGTSTPTFASATVSTASSGATAGAGGDELVIENSSTAGMSILSGTANDGNILFGDSGNSAIGYMQYKHSVNALAFGTNGSEVARFDSSGNFGIGTGAPDANLQIRGSGDRSLAITSGTAGAAILNFGDTTSGDFDIGSIIYDNANNSMQFKVNNSERLRIDSSGRVSIGTTSTNAPLRVKVATDANFTVQNTSSTVQLQAINDAGNAFTTLDIAGNPIVFSANGSERMRLTTNGLAIGFTSTDASLDADGYIRSKHATANGLLLNTGNDQWAIRNVSSQLTFEDDGTERMRIQSSGNLLFNTTGTAGSDLSDGGILFRRDSNTYMQIASGTESDTTLLYFYKKSGTGIAGVGDIKAMGNDVAINSTDEGRLHVGGTGRYSWSDTLFGPQNDNARDLGSTSARWKDAYLSGSLYVGGTAAANALDDYEEGEWTPTCPNVTLTSAGGHYTKIGNRVWVTFYLQFPTTSNGSAVQVNNLPFTVRNHDSGQARANGNRGGWSVSYSNSGQELRFLAGSGSTTITAYNFAGSTVNNNNVSAKSIYGAGYYEVA
jgi:hypothetical protein